MNSDANPAAAPAAPTATNPWDERISAFAQVTGKTPEVVNDALRPLVGEPGTDALAILSDPTAITDQDLQTALVGGEVKMPLGVFRKNLPKLRGPQITTTAMAEERPRGISFEMLPSVPEDVSFIDMLKVGGILQVGKTEVISAMKAALASRLGVFDLPDILVKKMVAFSKAQKKPVGANWFSLRKQITRRSYAEIFSAMDIEGFTVSEAAKNEFLQGLDEKLWEEIAAFYHLLKGWNDSWASGLANPGMALNMLMAVQGGRSGPMPAGMMEPPDTAGIRDAAEALIEKINEVFAGVGIPVARALAYDATKIKEVLDDPSLPAAVGATDREQMLNMLGVSVGADYVRLERSITRFVLAAMELPKLTPGNEEYNYLGAMLMLGSSIPWDKLPGGSDSSIGGRAGLGVPGRRNGAGSRFGE